MNNNDAYSANAKNIDYSSAYVSENAHSDASAKPQPYTVSQAVFAAKKLLEGLSLTVVGEVSEVSNKPGYKAVYFTVVDDNSRMSCIMWKNAYAQCGVELEVGMLVELVGNFSCYPKRGDLQFSVRRLKPAGEGNLRMQVALLARKLQAEGLMDPSTKRKTPALPQRIAIVTSPRGKAIHDCMRTLRRRYPLAKLMIFGVPVEGPSAPQHIQKGLLAAYTANPAPDVILLVRGGGSYEDLMPFNDEGLARTISDSPIPIVTGIGHEPDNSIADMVADVRCSTPTAAAEAVTPAIEELYVKLNNANRMLGSALKGKLDAAQSVLHNLSSRPVFCDSHYLTAGMFQTIDLFGDRLVRAIPDALSRDANIIAHLSERLLREGRALMNPFNDAFGKTAAKLELLSPVKTLARGYSISMAQDGVSVIDSIEKVSKGDNMNVSVLDGNILCKVKDVERWEK